MTPILRPTLATVHWHRLYGSGGFYEIGGIHGECNDSCYLAKIVPVNEDLKGPRDGDTFDPEKDEVRLNKQMKVIYNVIADGGWYTLERISTRAIYYGANRSIPIASVSARLRDFRKARFGGHTVDRRRTDVPGMFEYRLTWNEEVPRP
ncbi:MAG: hypothetical protein EP299_01735 [Acidobacteria bacterium]|nr:MAG: hypothetical protein EP299_01735 [Acidobacteriota bacterium]